MTTKFIRIAVLMMLTLLLASPLLAQCEEQEVKIQLLTRQIEAMKQQIETMQALQELGGKKRAAPAPKPSVSQAARNQGRQKAMALYDRIDALLGQQKIGEAKQALADFNAENQGTPAGGFTNSLTREMTAVGKPAPADWSIESWFQGESEVNFDSEGATLVVFWESWCPHCRNELPNIQEFHEEYRAKGLQIVGVTRLTKTATAEAVESLIAEHEVTYPIAKVGETLAEYFAVRGIPAAAIVKNGTIVWRGHPARIKPTLLDSLM